jgi:hypothetical protein
MPASRFGVAVQADADTYPPALECLEHRPAEQGPVGLNAHVHPGRHAIMERSDEFGQPVRAGQQRLTAMQDNVDEFESVPAGMVGNAPDGLGGYRVAHALRHVPPRLVRHFVDITVRARQIAPAVNLQDELAEGY